MDIIGFKIGTEMIQKLSFNNSVFGILPNLDIGRDKETEKDQKEDWAIEELVTVHPRQKKGSAQL